MLVNRKRPRLSASRTVSRDFNNIYATPRTQSDQNLDDSISSLNSPTPLANTDYRLAGGLDTPGGWEARSLELAGQRDEDDLRRASRFSRPITEPEKQSRSNEDFNSITGYNLRKNIWAVTGLAAGVGQAYDQYGKVKNKDYDFEQDEIMDSRMKSQNLPDRYPHSRNTSDTQNSGFSPTYSGHRVANSRQDSAAKNQWIWVEHQDSNAHDSQGDSSPVRKKPRASIASNRRSTHHEDADPYTLPTSTTTASYASARPRTISISRTLSYALPTTSSHVSRARPSTPRSSSAYTNTYTSPTKRHTTTGSIPAQKSSPISPEIQQYTRKRRREDRRQDQTFTRLNAQLAGLIREGYEALGSKVEVEEGKADAFDDHDYDEDEDEGYYDDDRNNGTFGRAYR